MRKTIIYSTTLLISMMAFMLGACTDEYEYSGVKVEGEQVYFSNALASTVELSQTESRVQIPVNRIQRNGELTVNLDVTVSEGSKVTVPNSVTFADGDSVAYLSIDYDPSQIEYGHYDEVSLSISDKSYTTPYGSSSYTFSIGLSEWKTLGSGLFREGILSSFYGSDVLTYNVEVQENINTAGKYRIVSPYGSGTDFYKNYVETGLLGWAGLDNTSMIIDATDPDYVYITGDFYPGTDDGMASQGYGVMHLFSVVDEEVKNAGSVETVKANEPELFGKMQDGVITFPEIGIYVNFDDSFEPLGYLNTSNLTIALPGYAFVDYSSSFTYTGRFIDTKDNYYAQGTITLGEDVASAKYVLAADGDDINSIIDGLNDGSVTPLGTITEGTDVSVQLEESGNYTMVIVTYDEEGNMRGSSSTTFTFNVNTTSADWQPLYNGTFTHEYQRAFIIEDMDDPESYVGNPILSMIENNYPSVIYQDVNNPTSYKVEPWIIDGQSLPFTMDNEGVITFSDVETGFSDRNNGTLYAGDANVKLGFGEPTSFISEELGGFVFGTVYYCGTDMWYGGAYEVFFVSGQANTAKSGKRKSVKALFNPLLKGKATRMSVTTKAKQMKLKGNLIR